MSYQHINLPKNGEKITVKNDRLVVPDQPILGFVEGDGIGPDITTASLRVWDAAVEKAYGGKRKVRWCELIWEKKPREFTRAIIFPRRPLTPSGIWWCPSRGR